MRQVVLGHWHYFTWHLPATALFLSALGLLLAMARALARNAYSHPSRALRWRILGWSALFAGACSAIVWPYVGAVAWIQVDGDGGWRLFNYLGLPLGRVRGNEVRELRGVDLGGLGFGIGHLEIRGRDGTVWRSVRVSRPVLDEAHRVLGYSSEMIRDRCGHRLVAAHRYGPRGPLPMDGSAVATVP